MPGFISLTLADILAVGRRKRRTIGETFGFEFSASGRSMGGEKVKLDDSPGAVDSLRGLVRGPVLIIQVMTSSREDFFVAD